MELKLNDSGALAPTGGVPVIQLYLENVLYWPEGKKRSTVYRFDTVAVVRSGPIFLSALDAHSLVYKAEQVE